METKLPQSFDAHDWAQEFTEICASKGIAVDEEWMVTWFSNALMAGYDHARAEHRAPSERTSAPALLGAEKHLETCAACNHGRTPCQEYRRNYESDSSLGSLESAAGKTSSMGDVAGAGRQEVQEGCLAALPAEVEQIMQRLQVHICNLKDSVTSRALAEDIETLLAHLRSQPAPPAPSLSEEQVRGIANDFTSQVMIFPNELREWREVRWETPNPDIVAKWFYDYLCAALRAAAGKRKDQIT